MVFSEVISLVDEAGSAVDIGLALFDTILDPVEVHHCSGLMC